MAFPEDQRSGETLSTLVFLKKKQFLAIKERSRPTGERRGGLPAPPSLRSAVTRKPFESRTLKAFFKSFNDFFFNPRL